MLVPLFNAVKVESVPLNSNYFSGNRRGGQAGQGWKAARNCGPANPSGVCPDRITRRQNYSNV